MCRPILRILFYITATLLAGFGVVSAKAMSVSGGLPAGIILFRIGLLYLAYLCVLLAIDLDPKHTDTSKGA